MRTLLIAAAFLMNACPLPAHEWFTDKTGPDGKKCCNNVDCRSVETRFNTETGEVEIQMNGKWWSAFDPNWYLGPSPDGAFYGCQMPSDKLPRCVWGAAGT